MAPFPTLARRREQTAFQRTVEQFVCSLVLVLGIEILKPIDDVGKQAFLELKDRELEKAMERGDA